MIPTNEYLSRVQTIRKIMWSVAWNILKNESDCCDAIQEAILKGWQKRDQLHNVDKFTGWQLRILINECRNIQRNHQNL